MKTCKNCKISLNLDAFESNGEYARNICRNCRLEQVRSSRQIRRSKDKEFTTEKICSVCDQTKSINNFNKFSLSPDGFAKKCRACYNKSRKLTSQNVSSSSTNKTLLCKTCNTYKDTSLFRPTKRSSTGYYKTCNDCWKPREWTKEKQKMSEKKYVEANREKIQAKWRKAGENINRRIRDRLNHRIADAMRSQNNRKNNSTAKYLGCDISYFKKWLEYQFTETINWENYGEWHIDHVIPCSSFKLENEDEQYKCFNWTNLRPCLAQENMEKGDRIIEELILAHKSAVSNFLSVNPLPTLSSDRVRGTE